MDNVTFDGNLARTVATLAHAGRAQGGGLYVVDGNGVWGRYMSMSNMTVVNNRAIINSDGAINGVWSGGGGIWWGSYAVVQVDSLVMKNNSCVQVRQTLGSRRRPVRLTPSLSVWMIRPGHTPGPGLGAGASSYGARSLPPPTPTWREIM